MTHGREKSDPAAVVAVKRTNKTERFVAESVEPRTGTKGNANRQSTHRAQNRASVSQASERIRKAATALRRQTPKGGSRMLELGTYGSVRGALSNERLHRDP
jgi:hypothetical protein